MRQPGSSTRRAAILLGIVALAPLAAPAWNGRLHFDIAFLAAQRVPEDMINWRPYAGLLREGSIRPDLWKGGDAAEGPRHYFEPENILPVALSNVPPRFEDFLVLVNRRLPQHYGLAPWTIADLRQRLTIAMAQTNWVQATRLAAALGHYVADTHQPLHCTANYDGYDTGNAGIHLRWEDGMPSRYWQPRLLKAEPGRLIDDPWAATLAWIGHAAAQVPAILAADRVAREEAGGDIESQVYYEALWRESGDLFYAQAAAAVTDLASLWYTAWVDAGRPPIPGPPRRVPHTSVFLDSGPAEPRGTPFPWIFLVALGAFLLLIIGLSMARQRRLEDRRAPPAD